MRMHQRIERIEFQCVAAGFERLRKASGRAKCMGVPVMGIDPCWIQSDRLIEFQEIVKMEIKSFGKEAVVALLGIQES